MTAWHRHFVYRRESWKTTWKLRVLVVFLVIAAAVLIRALWTERIAQSLVCTESAPHSDALLLENFDPDYLVFERAETLRRAGIASRTLVPTLWTRATASDESVTIGFVGVMARIARLPKAEIIPIDEVEPISLNAAKQIRDFLLKEHVRSVVVISPGFRSRRSALVYRSVLTPAGIAVGCVPVFGTSNPQNWIHTWHGIEDVVMQWGKLQYYRFYVLR